MTSKKQIEKWVREGREKGATHTLIVCDTFDYSDFPIHVLPGEDVKKIEKRCAEHMERVVERYFHATLLSLSQPVTKTVLLGEKRLCEICKMPVVQGESYCLHCLRIYNKNRKIAKKKISGRYALKKKGTEKGIGKGWFGESGRHSDAKRL